MNLRLEAPSWLPLSLAFLPRHLLVVECKLCSVKLSMDTDAIVKLAKAGAKEPVSRAYEVLLAPAVQREAIEQGKAGGHADALLIERNLKSDRVKARTGRRVPRAEEILAGLRLSPGEEDALRLYLTARADAVVSDDFEFHRKLHALRIPRFTPALLLVDLVAEGSLRPEEGLRLLEQLAKHIAPEEYYVARNLMGAV